MESKDLRIGNIIEYDNNGTSITVKGLSNRNVYYNSDCYSDYKSMNGIPLTEEWLLKFGFVKQIGFYKFIGGKFKNSLEVAHNDLDKWYCYYRNFNKGEVDDFVLLRNDLKHVHQLQNLYFALTGQELKHKESPTN